MKPGRYAAPDGSFARSAGGAGARGLALLALALIIGVVLLNATDADPPGTNVSTKGSSSSSSDKGSSGQSAGTTTTTVAPTTTQPAHAPKDVKVIVANASTVKGAAGGGRTALLAAQYNVLAPANSAPVADSAVYFTPGYDRDALAIAGVLQLPGAAVKPLPAPAPFDIKGANVAVVLGADAAPRFGTQAATTTTTAKPAAGATTTAKPAAGATTTTARPAGVTTTTAAATTTTKKP